MVDCTGLENRQRATVREFESHRLRQNYFDKLLIFKVNVNILPITNQQANIKTTIKSRDAGCMTAFVFLRCHSPPLPRKPLPPFLCGAAKSHGTSSAQLPRATVKTSALRLTA